MDKSNINTSTEYKEDKRVSLWQLSVIGAVIVSMTIGALMIAVLRSEHSATQVQADIEQRYIMTQQAELSQVVDNTNNEITIEQATQILNILYVRDLLQNYGVSVREYQVAYNDIIQKAFQLRDSATEDVQARFAWGSEKFGWYAYNDKRGYTKIIQEIGIWAAASGVAVAVAIVATVIGILGVLPTLGLSAAVILKIWGVVGTIFGMIWLGPGKEAVIVKDYIERKCQAGQSYGFSRHYSFGITTGYSAW